MEKISFIIYYDEERTLQECVYYIEQLSVPKGFELDFWYVKDATSLEEIQNKAMQACQSRYKVYLDQNTLIIHKFFLYEILQCFRENPDVGMLGIWGSDNADIDNLGRMLLWDEKGISEVNYVRERRDVDAYSLGEMLVATQYSSKEGTAGSRMIIPYQDSSWCIYDCRVDKGVEIEREYRYLLLRSEIFHDVESREQIGKLLADGSLSLEQQIGRAYGQALARTITHYYWEDYYYSERKWKKLLPANGRISLERADNEDMNIVMSFNHAYVKYARVMLQSLYENNGLVNISVHVLHCDLQEADKAFLQEQAKKFGQQISFYDFDKTLLPEKIITTAEWSIEAYFRLFMTEILPQSVKRLLYLDVDVIINKPIYDFYYMDMQEREIVGCRDFPRILKEDFGDKRKELFDSIKQDERFVYINSGVMLVDLEQLRGKIRGTDYMKVLQEQLGGLLAPDQDIINLVHWENIGLVDEFRYDFFNSCLKGLEAREVKQLVSIIHYAGPKPWMPIDINVNAHRIWWEYAKLLENTGLENTQVK